MYENLGEGEGARPPPADAHVQILISHLPNACIINCVSSLCMLITYLIYIL